MGSALEGEGEEGDALEVSAVGFVVAEEVQDAS